MRLTSEQTFETSSWLERNLEKQVARQSLNHAIWLVAMHYGWGIVG